ncbi:MAG: histidinol dehydrogenase [Deltaproteobacteria bacterium]|nr:histidinol dehydrogenase [Deltaproteobacteria bacterium]
MRVVKSKDIDSGLFQRYSPEESNRVKAIIAGVRRSGDRALRDFCREFDDAVIDEIKVRKEEIKGAYDLIEAGVMEAIKVAVSSAAKIAQKQLKSIKGFSLKDKGLTFEMRVNSIRRVGCYVPGGARPLPSTAVMLVTPAKAAGVEEIVLCTPPKKDGCIDPTVMVAADMAGVTEIYRVGGAQSIAAMAYGTESIKPVDMIVGPGNRYVQAAKREVFGRVGVEFLTGPSEICIVADSSANDEIVALDLIAQAEHDRDARIILLTDNERLARFVAERLEELAEEIGTREILRRSVDKGQAIVLGSLDEAPEIANKLAPEHLVLMTRKGKRFIEQFKVFGTMFLGRYASVAVGDYLIGPNYTLPTQGGARYSGGLSALSFLRLSNVVQVTKEGYDRLSYPAQNLARVEGFDGHWRSIMARASQAARKRAGMDKPRVSPAKTKKEKKKTRRAGKRAIKALKGAIPKGKKLRASNAIKGFKRGG